MKSILKLVKEESMVRERSNALASENRKQE